MKARWRQDASVGLRFWPDVRPHLPRLAVVGLFSLAVIALEILRPWAIKWIFDGALVPPTDADMITGAPGPIRWLMELALTPEGEIRFSAGTVVAIGVGASLVIALAHAAAQYVRDMSIARVNHGVTRNLRFRIFAHLSRLSPFFFARHKSGDLMVRLMGDVPQVSVMLVDSSVEIATRSLLVVLTIAVMLSMDPVLTGILLVALPLILLVVRWISTRITIAVRKQRRKEGDLADYLHEAIAAAPVIQSLGGSDHVVRRFARSNRRSARAGLKARRLGARMSASVEALLAMGLAGTLAFGSWRVLEGSITAGDLLVFLSYVRGLLKPIRAASRHAQRIAKGSACGERILTILDERAQVESQPGAAEAPAHPSELAFDGVTLSYGRDLPAVSNVSVAFKRGELTALVGRSGAGKSTLASLALRLFDPDIGTVRLDGMSIRELDLDSVRDRVGLCMQSTVLLGETIRENLLLARPEAEDEELWRVCSWAGVDDVVQNLPEGLDTSLDAGGAGLSGGQARRLTIARTLLRGSSVLFVDEPFAGLDRDATARVAETLRSLASERIVIVIAHDLGDIDQYDRVVLLEEGRVAATGNHRDLAAHHELYRQVVRGAEATP